MYDSAGVRKYTITPQQSGDTPCQNTNPFTGGGTMFTAIHGHGFIFLEDTLPSNCGFAPGRTSMPGPSSSDWARSYADGKPHVILDPDFIWVYGPPDSMEYMADSTVAPRGNYAATRKMYPRRVGSCVRM